MTIKTDLHVEWAKLETESPKLNFAADLRLQQQLEAEQIAFECKLELLYHFGPLLKRRPMPPDE